MIYNPHMIQKPSEGQKPEQSEFLKAPEVVLRPNTPEEEFRQIKQTIHKKDFFKQHGYSFVLPETPTLREPIPPELENQALKVFMQSEYDTEFYAAGLAALETQKAPMDEAVQKFTKWHNDWGFHIPETYTVRLTRYGSGGNFNSNTGNIVMLTTREGTFKKGANPANTIIHEATHIGLEKDFVRKHELTHDQKERLVDLVVAHHFKDLLPNYKLQSRGDSSIDSFLDVGNLTSLDSQLEAFTKARQ